jgi:hypothetical protein
MQNPTDGLTLTVHTFFRHGENCGRPFSPLVRLGPISLSEMPSRYPAEVKAMSPNNLEYVSGHMYAKMIL